MILGKFYGIANSIFKEKLEKMAEEINKKEGVIKYDCRTR